MHWPGTVQKTGTLSRIERYQDDIRPVVLYTHTFVLVNKQGRADERCDCFFTGLGSTPQEAETAAEMVYLRSTACAHHFVRKTPTLLECRACGIQQRTLPGQSLPGATQPGINQPGATQPGEKPPVKAGRGGLFGLFRKS